MAEIETSEMQPMQGADDHHVGVMHYINPNSEKEAPRFVPSRLGPVPLNAIDPHPNQGSIQYRIERKGRAIFIRTNKPGVWDVWVAPAVTGRVKILYSVRMRNVRRGTCAVQVARPVARIGAVPAAPAAAPSEEKKLRGPPGATGARKKSGKALGAGRPETGSAARGRLSSRGGDTPDAPAEQKGRPSGGRPAGGRPAKGRKPRKKAARKKGQPAPAEGASPCPEPEESAAEPVGRAEPAGETKERAPDKGAEPAGETKRSAPEFASKFEALEPDALPAPGRVPPGYVLLPQLLAVDDVIASADERDKEKEIHEAIGCDGHAEIHGDELLRLVYLLPRPGEEGPLPEPTDPHTVHWTLDVFDEARVEA